MPPVKADTTKLDAVFGNVESISKWREKKNPLPESRRWDRHPVMRKRKGQGDKLFEFFTIGALAEALGRQPVTIRSWEDKKILPREPYRDPPPARSNLPDKVSKGLRLYSRQHIESAIAAAKASGVYDPANAPNANWPEFARLVRLAWSTL